MTRSSLTDVLADAAALHDALEARGWREDDFPIEITRPRLKGARLFVATEYEDAPRLLVLWRDGFSKRAVHGKQLRALQQDANELRDRLRAGGYADPELALVGCADFLIAFPLDGNAHTRRLRLTPRILERSERLTQFWDDFEARALADWRERDEVVGSGDGDEDDGLGFLGELIARARKFDWRRLHVGRALDEEFVAFMGVMRQHIAELLLSQVRRAQLLDPILEVLARHWGPDDASSNTPPALEEIVHSVSLRSSLIATVDTVLLRLVLYRYLDAQYDYTPDNGEARAIALGSYDALLQDATVDDESFERLLTHARRVYGLQRPGSDANPVPEPDPTGQLDLFASVVSLPDAPKFKQQASAMMKRHRADAGGDLHQGEIARAADLLQDYILEERPGEFAALLEGTRSNRFSFHYADLDPRAFQQFYEDTIGTDIRLRYNPEDDRVVVRVEEWHRNQKEQGAYYTDERMASWLAERTLGKKIDTRFDELFTLLRTGSSEAGFIPAVREQLHRLANLRVIDFACGGGIFLRAAFEQLSSVRGRVVAALETNLSEDQYKQLKKDPIAALFAPGTAEGHWEWHILLHCIHGVDRDIKALNVASNMLTLSALTYKPYGVAFPSFVNVNLKPGNAFVIPIEPARREQFVEAFREELVELIEARQKLRSEELDRPTWRRLHDRATELTTRIVNTQIATTFEGVFGKDVGHEELVARVRRVGCCLYEAEFPEAYFNPDGTWREESGFDVVLGNPPWEEPAAEYKHFLPEFDAEYQSLKGKASKQREAELLADPEISRRWKLFQDSVEDYRKLLETTELYKHQNTAIKGKRTGAHSNLYKYAVELGYHLTRKTHGAVGMVIDGGLWSDRSATGLRKLLLDHARIEAICGFTNTSKIFEGVDGRQKFSCTIFTHDDADETFPAVFMRREIEDLDDFETLAAELNVQEIRADRSETYPVPEIRSQAHANADFALAHHPRLSDDAWNIDTYSRELNGGEQRHFFIPVEDAESTTVPLIKGAQFNLWGVHQGSLPEYHVSLEDDAAGGFLRDRQLGRIHGWIAGALREQGLASKSGSMKDVAEKWLEDTTGTPDLPDEWLRLDLDGYRIAWRDMARNDDQRTLIAGIIPPGVALTDKAPFVRPFRLAIEDEEVVWKHQYAPKQLLYLCGMLSSFPCDAIVRGRVAKTTVSSQTFKRTEVPQWTGSSNQQRIATLCAQLTCLPTTTERPWADYTNLAAEVGLDPDRDGLIEPDARYEAEVELNARAAYEYELKPEAFTFLMDLLFMTPTHAAVHRQLEQDIAAYMKTL